LREDRGVDALLFDLGGVVIDVDWRRVFEAWARGARVAAADIATRFAFDDRYEAHERGEIGPEEYCAHLRGALGVALDDDALLAGWNCLFVGPVPGMTQLLERLARSYPLYAFSNTNRAHVAHWRPRYRDLLEPFSAVYYSCEIGARKPDAAAFLAVATRIGVAPARIAFFDDHAGNVEGAHEAGLLAHEVHSADDVREALRRSGIPAEGAG
jgi:putative hydrolase of the HAD superfamily